MILKPTTAQLDTHILKKGNKAPGEYLSRIQKNKSPIAKSTLQMSDVITVPVQIEAGVMLATFDLQWKRNW